MSPQWPISESSEWLILLYLGQMGLRCGGAQEGGSRKGSRSHSPLKKLATPEIRWKRAHSGGNVERLRVRRSCSVGLALSTFN